MDYNYSEWLYNPWFLTGLALEILFKGIGLWRAGRNDQLGWFIAMFLINTAGILPLIYILFFQRKKKAVY